MNLSNEFHTIRDWAWEKKIIPEGNMIQQYVKFQEEAGELAKAILKNDKDQIIDAIGDIVVTLVSVAGQASIKFEENITIEHCINTAYEVIKNRTGKIVNGDFHKYETRPCDDCQGRGKIRKPYTETEKINCETCGGTGQIKQ